MSLGYRIVLSHDRLAVYTSDTYPDLAAIEALGVYSWTCVCRGIGLTVEAEGWRLTRAHQPEQTIP